MPIFAAARNRLSGISGAAVGLLASMTLLTPGAAEAQNAASRGLANLSLEELADIEVISASRQLEPNRAVPSAIFVLTGEDLRRSGVTSVPQALRLVPGVQVGRVDANKWAVSMRGYNSREANKLLVLVDGRSIYDPLFSGMLWESQDFLMEDIDRIEVIRGPGGTLWGANAFDGVVNIITRHTAETNGTLATLTAGDEEQYIVGVRHGWQAGEHQNARVYVKARERDTGYSEIYTPFDASRDVRGGFRWDWENDGADRVRVSGDIFESSAGTRETPALAHTTEHRGRNMLARWARQTSPESGWRLQFYYDHVNYDSIGFAQARDTYDLELQQNLLAGSRHRIVWGAGYRRMHDHALSRIPGLVDVLPARRRDVTKTIFMQDTVALLPDTLQLILGLKFEDTDYADEQWLPNVRLAWTPSPEQTWWAAVSEATRVPSRLESDLTFFGTIRIGDELEAERVRAYEAGYRRLLSSSLWFDLALFHNDYERLATTEANGLLSNFMRGHTRGVELALRWEPLRRLRLNASYAYMDMDLSLDPSSTSNSGVLTSREGLFSPHRLSIRSIVELTGAIDLDATLRYADALSTFDIPRYTQLDLALTWRPSSSLELALVGSNLLDAHQPEQVFVSSSTGIATEIERSVYLRAAWRR